MTAIKQRAMRIINAMPESEVERFVSMNILLEPNDTITENLQTIIDSDIEKTQDAIAEGCEMLSVEESYNRLREKYGF